MILILLVVDPVNRLMARMAKESRWLKMWSKRENGGRSLTLVICKVLSFTLLPEKIQVRSNFI